MSKTLARSIPLAGVAALALAAPAAAQSTVKADVAGGATTLKLDAGVAKVLKSNGVSVGVVGPAKAGRSGIAFPVTGGAIRPATLAGSVRHSGGLRLRAGGKSLVLRNFTYTVRSRGSVLTAQVGKARVPILSLNLSRAKVGRSGPLTKTASGISVSLTSTAAGALNKTFGVRLFKRGLKLGTVATKVDLGEAVFGGGATTLSLDPGAVSALGSLGIVATPFGSAGAGAGGFAFPIDRGKVNAETLAGTIGHFGSGINFYGPGGQRIRLVDFVIGIDETPALSARIGNSRVDILDLDVSQIQRSTTADGVVVGNVGARLTAGAAAALNQTFATTAFTAGLKLGTATVNGTTR